jgi:hypothetical protein
MLYEIWRCCLSKEQGFTHNCAKLDGEFLGSLRLAESCDGVSFSSFSLANSVGFTLRTSVQMYFLHNLVGAKLMSELKDNWGLPKAKVPICVIDNSVLLRNFLAQFNNCRTNFCV